MNSNIRGTRKKNGIPKTWTRIIRCVDFYSFFIYWCCAIEVFDLQYKGAIGGNRAVAND